MQLHTWLSAFYWKFKKLLTRGVAAILHTSIYWSVLETNVYMWNGSHAPEIVNYLWTQKRKHLSKCVIMLGGTLYELKNDVCMSLILQFMALQTQVSDFEPGRDFYQYIIRRPQLTEEPKEFVFQEFDPNGDLL